MNSVHRGRQGELLAEQWLKQRGFLDIHHNLQTPFAQVDLTARKNGVFYLFEVKMSASLPQIQVNQWNRLHRASLYLRTDRLMLIWIHQDHIQAFHLQPPHERE